MTTSFGRSIDALLAECDAHIARADRAERDAIELHVALHHAIKRLKALGGEYDDLLRVLKKTGSN